LLHSTGANNVSFGMQELPCLGPGQGGSSMSTTSDDSEGMNMHGHMPSPSRKHNAARDDKASQLRPAAASRAASKPQPLSPAVSLDSGIARSHRTRDRDRPRERQHDRTKSVVSSQSRLPSACGMHCWWTTHSCSCAVSRSLQCPQRSYESIDALLMQEFAVATGRKISCVRECALGLQDWCLETITEAEQRWSAPGPDELPDVEAGTDSTSRRRSKEPQQSLAVRSAQFTRVQSIICVCCGATV
jgi:hypothetical protein